MRRTQWSYLESAKDGEDILVRLGTGEVERIVVLLTENRVVLVAVDEGVVRRSSGRIEKTGEGRKQRRRKKDEQLEVPLDAVHETQVVVVGDDPAIERRAEERFENGSVAGLVELDECTDGSDGLLPPTTLLVDELDELMRELSIREDRLVLRLPNVVDPVPGVSFGVSSVSNPVPNLVVLRRSSAILVLDVLTGAVALGQPKGHLAGLVLRAGDVLAKRTTFGFDVATLLALLLRDVLIDDPDLVLHAADGGVEGPLVVLSTGEKKSSAEKRRKRGKMRTFHLLMRSFSAFNIVFSSSSRGSLESALMVESASASLRLSMED